MSETTFLRLLKEQDKGGALLAAISASRAGDPNEVVHRVSQQTFRKIPGAPFAYWVSDTMRGKFADFRSLQGNFANVRVGLQTSDDFRFVRATWEVLPGRIAQSKSETFAGRPWVGFAKGGEYSPYYSDVHLLVNWTWDGTEMKAWADPLYGNSGWSRIIKSPDFYFRPGLTWPRRTQAGLSVRVLPAGCIFADKGPAIFATDEPALLFLLGVVNSKPGRELVELQMAFGSYEVGVLQKLPIPEKEQAIAERVVALTRLIYDFKRSIDSGTETSHSFTLPSLIQHESADLKERLEDWIARTTWAAQQIEAAHREIDEISYQLYKISPEDRTAIHSELGADVRGLPRPLTPVDAAADMLSWMVGVAIGRFDVRLASGPRPIPEIGDPFAPLPAHSPGMLPDGKTPTDYPLEVAADGILVEDEGHDEDIVNRVQEVFHLLWGEGDGTIEREALEMLGAASLRDYLSRSGKGGFWETHVARYSKSRRTAPVYWLLQSAHGSYSVWLYCHRMSGDTLHKLLGPRYLGGRIQRVRDDIEELRPAGEKKKGLSKKEEGRLAELDELLAEIEVFEARIKAALQRINDRDEPVGYEPNLDDGVVLAAAPLHELIPWPRRVKYRGRQISELAAYWEELTEGKYDWAHIAMHYWPNRVTEKCRKDKSFALAHGLDEQFFPGLREELRRQAAVPAAEAPPDEEQLEDEENE